MTVRTARPGLRVWLDGEPMPDTGDWVLQLEVDERADEASTFRMTVDMSPIASGPGEGDWDVLEHGTFAEERGVPDLGLFRRVTVQFVLTSDDPSEPEVSATVFDGFVTAVEAVFGESRVPDSTLVLTGVDASCLMHLETVTRTWDEVTDAAIAVELFEKYGFAVRPGAGGDATIDDTGLDRVRSRASLLQRSTDAEMLRLLARRNGFEAYVEPSQGPVTSGPHPGRDVEGHFHPSRVDADPQPPLDLFPREAPTLIDLRARYDGMQPTRFLGWNIDERTRLVRRADVTDPAYGRMGTHSRADVMRERLAAIAPVRRPGGSGAASGNVVPGAGSPAAAAGQTGGPAGTGGALELIDIQSADVPHTEAELASLARAELRLADWFVVGTGTVQGERYPAIVRSRRPVTLRGAGHLLDGRWYVRGVRHRWGVDPDAPEEEQTVRRYEADVTIVRNALGGMG